MTSLQLLAPDQKVAHSSTRPQVRRPLKTRWHYGRAYVVIAAIAPVVLLSLFLVHVHARGQEGWNTLVRWFSAKG